MTTIPRRNRPPTLLWDGGDEDVIERPPEEDEQPWWLRATAAPVSFGEDSEPVAAAAEPPAPETPRFGVEAAAELWKTHKPSARTELKLQAGAGVLDAARHTLETLDEFSAWLGKHGIKFPTTGNDLVDRPFATVAGWVPDPVKALGPTIRPDGHAIRKTTEFLTGFGAVAKAGRALFGAGQAASTAGQIARTGATGAVADFLVSDPHEERLSNYWLELGLPPNRLFEYLAADKDDGVLEGKLKSALEGVGLSTLAEGIVLAAKAARAARRAHTETEIAKAPELTLPSGGIRYIPASENLTNGRYAADMVLRHSKDMPEAMYRSDVGNITFNFGWAGDPNRKFKHGYGLSHIIARRNLEGANGEEFVRETLPQVLTYGRLESIVGKPDARRAVIRYRDDLVTLSLHRDGKRETWVLTGYEKWKDGADGARRSSQGGP